MKTAGLQFNKELFVLEYFDNGALLMRLDNFRFFKINKNGVAILREIETGKISSPDLDFYDGDIPLHDIRNFIASMLQIGVIVSS